MSENILKVEREFELLWQAKQKGIDEEVISYAKQIQRQLSVDGDIAEWLDCLQMAYNEIVQAT
jgi:hypothetical protein